MYPENKKMLVALFQMKTFTLISHLKKPHSENSGQSQVGTRTKNVLQIAESSWGSNVKVPHTTASCPWISTLQNIVNCDPVWLKSAHIQEVYVQLIWAMKTILRPSQQHLFLGS